MRTQVKEGERKEIILLLLKNKKTQKPDNQPTKQKNN